MDKHRFSQLYWKNYISVEKEFMQTLSYIDFDKENYKVFSSAYIKLLLQIGSEIDIVAKSFCRHYNNLLNVKNIDEYRKEILKYVPDFASAEVKILQGDVIHLIKPWGAWNITAAASQPSNPIWWKVYNMVKHHRTESGSIEGESKEYYKFANLEYTLFALAGLYQILIYYFFELAKTERIKVPLPGSHLFELSGGKWDTIIFYQDFAFYVDDSDGNLYSETGEFIY